MTKEKKPKKPKEKKEKPKKVPPKYDYYNSLRGAMTPLVTQTTVKVDRKFMTLVEWPKSLISAWKAGILCGLAEKDAEVLSQPRGQELDHPWNRAVISYQPVKAVHV